MKEINMEDIIKKVTEHAKDKTVLYVDDDRLTREIGKIYLSRVFKEVVLAKDGQDGLDKYLERAYDLVVTDINMPIMDGTALVSYIKAIQPEQLVVVTSSYLNDENIMSLIGNGVDKFIYKPFDHKSFFEAMHDLYRRVEKNEDLKNISKAAAKSVIDHLTGPAILFDDDGILKANKSFLKTIGYKSNKAFKQDFAHISEFFENSIGCEGTFENLESRFENEYVITHKVKLNNKCLNSLVSIELAKLSTKNIYVVVFKDTESIKSELEACPDETKVAEHLTNHLLKWFQDSSVQS